MSSSANNNTTDEQHMQAEEYHNEDVEETYVEDDEVADVVNDDDDDAMEGAESEGEAEDMMYDEDEEGSEAAREGEVLLEDDSIQGFFTHKEPVFSISMHPKDPHLVVSGGGDDRAFNATESVEAVGLCSVLPLAASGSVDGSLSIWDINTMRLRTTLSHDDSVTGLLWHDESPLLTSVSMDCTVRTWDARTGDCVRVSRGHQEGIMDFALSRDGHTVVTASDDGCCLVFSQ
ncbi:60S ribosomal subunit assembly or modification protein [Coemansia erecta]|nr:60S ribosomal subunit assembly or modification protein [Coemansia erecta]